ncbi:hypothetical protein [Rhodococcus jostii]
MRDDSLAETDIVRRDGQFAGNVVPVDSVLFHRAPAKWCTAIDRIFLCLRVELRHGFPVVDTM